MSDDAATADLSSDAGLDEIREDLVWQMVLGERVAFEGVLALVRPKLAIEIGTAQGASLRWLARTAEEVHSFDLVAPSLAVPSNVTLHPGDSHKLLPEFLAKLSEEGRNVDFVLVDGDHSPEGVYRDMVDLLDSPAIGRTAIIIHDTGNERVRSGIDAVPYGAYPKVAHVDLDLVPGHVGASEALKHELWWGLGLVVVDASRSAYFTDPVVANDRHHHGEVLVLARNALVAQEAEAEADEVERKELEVQRADEDALRARVAELEADVIRLEALTREQRERWDATMRSLSWRVTAPLRSGKKRARRLLDD